MKKTLLLLTLAGGLAGTAQAQKLSVGLKGGATYAGLTGRDVRNTDFKIGFHAGLMADYAFSDGNSVAIHPEVLYSLKGFEAKENYTPFPDVDLSYVDVPLLLRYKANGLYFEVGPQASFLLSADQQGTDIKPLFKTVSIDYAGGFGIESANGVSLGVRYNGGLNNVFKPIQVPNASGGTDETEVRGKGGTFLVSLGYYFKH